MCTHGIGGDVRCIAHGRKFPVASSPRTRIRPSTKTWRMLVGVVKRGVIIARCLSMHGNGYDVVAVLCVVPSSCVAGRWCAAAARLTLGRKFSGPLTRTRSVDVWLHPLRVVGLWSANAARSTLGWEFLGLLMRTRVVVDWLWCACRR